MLLQVICNTLDGVEQAGEKITVEKTVDLSGLKTTCDTSDRAEKVCEKVSIEEATSTARKKLVAAK
jgi:hypothetical protein